MGQDSDRVAQMCGQSVSRWLDAAKLGASEMAVRAPAPTAPVAGQTAVSAATAWAVEPQPGTAEGGPSEGRAERWATWVLIYLAVLTTSLAIGASLWALGLLR